MIVGDGHRAVVDNVIVGKYCFAVFLQIRLHLVVGSFVVRRSRNVKESLSLSVAKDTVFGDGHSLATAADKTLLVSNMVGSAEFDNIVAELPKLMLTSLLVVAAIIGRSTSLNLISAR